MRVSLARPQAGASRAALPLLQAGGARTVLGVRPTVPAAPIVPSRRAVFGPRGACLAAAGGPLVVCDTGHHRLLIWHALPAADDTPADVVIGQADFEGEARNGGGDAGPATLNVPTGVAIADGVMAIADAWNHRVLLWHGIPRDCARPADVVLGQPDFSSTQLNRGMRAAGADSLYWPYGVALDSGRIYVADTGNNRVLVWDALPATHGAPADHVVGRELRWPHGIWAAGERLLVADPGLGHVAEWRGLAPYAVHAGECGMPYGVTLLGDRLVVADTADSRLLGFDPGEGLARYLAGQAGFGLKGDNRWGFATRESVCWPYAVAACGDTLVVADTGNNRVLLWERA